MFLPGCPSYLSKSIQCAHTPSARLDKNIKYRDYLALAMELNMRQKTIDEEKFQILGFEDLKSKLVVFLFPNSGYSGLLMKINYISFNLLYPMLQVLLI